MGLLKTIYGEAEADPGTWFVWRQEGEEKIEFLVRHIPPAERRRIHTKHLGRKMKLRIGGGNFSELDHDRYAQEDATREMVSYCLLDSRGFTAPVGPQLAASLSEALGEKVGQEVTLDGRWSAGVKDAILRSGIGAELMAWVDEKATELVAQARAEEKEASGN
jgi:hypothetical protein